MVRRSVSFGLALLAANLSVFLACSPVQDRVSGEEVAQEAPVGPGVIASASLQAPLSVLDHMVSELDEDAREWASADGPAYELLASEVMEAEVRRGIRLPVSLSAGVMIDSLGSVVPWVVAAGGEVIGEPAEDTCELMLGLFAGHLFGLLAETTTPVGALQSRMGTVLNQDRSRAAAAAAEFWRHVRMRFTIVESMSETTTRCGAQATNAGWEYVSVDL